MGVRGIELLVVKDEKSKKDEGSGKKIRLVQWVYEKKEGGEGSTLKLEKRSYFRNDAGEDRSGKAEGFGLSDLEALKPHWVHIIELMKNPPKIVAATAAPAASGDAIEEVPF